MRLKSIIVIGAIVLCGAVAFLFKDIFTEYLGLNKMQFEENGSTTTEVKNQNDSFEYEDDTAVIELSTEQRMQILEEIASTSSTDEVPPEVRKKALQEISQDETESTAKPLSEQERMDILNNL